MYKKILCCLLVVTLVLAAGGIRIILPVNAVPLMDDASGSIGTITTMNDFTDDCVMVVLTHEASLEFINYAPADFPEIDCAEIEDLSSAKGAKVQAVLRGEQLEMDSIGARFMNQNIDIDGFRRILCLKLANPGKGNVLRAIAALEQREDVYSAEPNYIIQMDAPVDQEAIVPPDDLPVYGWAATKIEQEAAWEIETGSSSVLVGVLDSGIDSSHPEFNGRINTTLSRDFVGDGYAATDDPYGHGTHVAGIIAARNNSNTDALNFSGVCQNVKLVSLRVLDTNNAGIPQNIASAIEYAENEDIPILNMSMSGPVTSNTAIEQALNNYSGLIVCAAGNGGEDIDEDEVVPACLDNDRIISVGASASGDIPWENSNYGENNVDLFAPGDSIVSCYPREKCSSTDCQEPGHRSCGFHYKSGTSMAVPFVTGVAALILAHNPYSSPYSIKRVILESVDQISAFSSNCVSGGRLNALDALSHPLSHCNTPHTYVDATYHRITCPDCGLSWLEEHDIHPGLGTCRFCQQI